MGMYIEQHLSELNKALAVVAAFMVEVKMVDPMSDLGDEMQQNPD